MSGLIDSYEEAYEFSKNPIRSYDPQLTNDIYLFQSTFDDFVHFLRGAILSNHSRITKGLLVSLYVDVIQKCKAYQAHRGISLLPYTFLGNEKKSVSFYSLFSADSLTYDHNNGHFPL